MKKYLYLSVFLLILTNVKAECIEGDPECIPDPTETGGGDGVKAAPVDEFTGFLIVMGTLLAGAVVYKKRELVKKEI